MMKEKKWNFIEEGKKMSKWKKKFLEKKEKKEKKILRRKANRWKFFIVYVYVWEQPCLL